MIIKNVYSLHVLNYNSSGATDALPLNTALITPELIADGILSSIRRLSAPIAIVEKTNLDITTIDQMNKRQ